MSRPGRTNADSVTDVIKKRNLIGYGLKIKKLRKDINMTAYELADLLGVTVGSIRNWECGLTRPDPEYLVKMFSILKVDPNTFFGIEGIGGALTETEQKVVDVFRLMDSNLQGEFIAIGNAMLDHRHRTELKEAEENIIAIPDWGQNAAAGTGEEETQQNEENLVLLYNEGPAARADVIITVYGHSMEPTYHSGDRVLVERCEDVQLGQVYVFLIRGQGYVIKQAEEGCLHSLNEEFDDIVPGEFDEVELIGHALGTVTVDMIPSREEKELYWEAREIREKEEKKRKRKSRE